MKTQEAEENISSAIRTVRGQKVILDSDLARIYGVTTKRLNEQVKRNTKRFPSDFLFQLTGDEVESLSPDAVAICDRIRTSQNHPVAKCDRIQTECPLSPLRLH